MTRVALPDVTALSPADQAQTATPETGAAAVEPHETPTEDVHALHEKLESAFAPDPAELPPKIYQSGFDAAIRQQTTAFQDLSARVERLEDSEEIQDLRNALREMCEILSGLTAEQERGAAERDARSTALAEAVKAGRNADLERVKALTEVVAAERAADRAQLMALEESTKAMAASHEKSMAEIRSSLALIGEHIKTVSKQNEAVSRDLVEMKSELAGEADKAFDKHLNALNDLEKAVAVLKNHDDSATNRIAVLESGNEDLVRRIEANHETATANAEKGDKFETVLEDTNRVITDLQSRNGELLARIVAIRDEIGDSTAEVHRGYQRQLTELEKCVGTLQEHDLQAQERVKALRVHAENLARDISAVRNEMMEFNEATDVVQAHQKVLEQTEEILNDLKARQAQSFAWIDSMDKRHEELASSLSQAKVELKGWTNQVNDHRGLLEENASLLSDLKRDQARAAQEIKAGEVRQAHSAQRIEAVAVRQEEFANELQQTKADLKVAGTAAEAHQRVLESAEKTITELKDRVTRAADALRTGGAH